MDKPVLVIMAAGMGSRYGGLKQIDPIDAYGNLIIDYSIYDAKKAGFEKIVCIIKEADKEGFEEVIGYRIGSYIQTEYAYQDMTKLPEGYSIPEGRTKPWGTGHAVFCAKDKVKGPFAVINADDYYGPKAFELLYKFLSNMPEDSKEYMMVGYYLKNTVTENGHVARGICQVSEDHQLKDITERTHIEKKKDGIYYTEDDGDTWEKLPEDSITSMNMWGFSPLLFDALGKELPSFLDEAMKTNPLKGEYFLPTVVDKQLQKDQVSVHVAESSDRWYGVTYYKDKATVMEAITGMKKEGLYPETLWEKKDLL